MKRRQWLQNSLLSSAGLVLAPVFPSSLLEEKEVKELLRLHWNENPFGPSTNVIKAIQEAVPKGNLYWDEKIETISEQLAQMQGRSKDQYLMTSGSTEVLALLGQHVGLQKKTIVTGSQSFPTLPMFGERCGASINKVPMEGYRLDLDRMLSTIDANTGLVFVCNPNNPTSAEVDPNALKTFCRNVPEEVILCVDEAYIEFSKNGLESSVVDLVDELPNLVVARTFSKAYGMAGFRLGYAISQNKNIQALSYRYPSLGMAPGLLPLVGGMAALEDQDFVNHTVEQTNKGKEIMYRAFNEWGIEYAPSSTNFIYVNKKGFRSEIRSKLRDQNILITQWPSMKGHIRISVGKEQWMHQLVNKMEDLRV